MTLLPDLKSRRILLILIIALLGWHVTRAQSYCRPALGSCCEWISNVSIGALDHNSINEPGYADYTSMSATLSKGTTIPISVKVSTNSIYIEHVKVFFDWDRDFIFESFVYLGSAKFTGSNIFTGDVTVPPNALDGCSMMRVFMQYAKEPAGACTSSGDGEVEDYTVVVSGSSAPVANFSTPNSLCSQQSISFTNLSAISDGAPLNYLWNFDDGTSSTAASPTKTFDEPGTYLVNLTASTFCTTHSITKTIIVNPPPVITDQPASTTICVGGTTTFSITSPTPGVTYQWQVDKGTGFTDIVSNSTYKNTTTSSLMISAIVAGMRGYQYRCRVTKNCPISSSAATLNISSPPVITDHPADASVCRGGTTTLLVNATGAGITYQWQIDAGEGFKDLINDPTYSNATTHQLTITGVISDFEAYRYRCLVSAMCTSVSSAAKIKINDAPLISTQPADARVFGGEFSTFSITASGDELTYQWQKNTVNGFVDLGENDRYKNVRTPLLKIDEAALSENNTSYRCVLSGVCTPGLISDPAKLIVINPRPEISSSPITEIKEDSSYSYQLSVIDFTTRPLLLSAERKPDWLTFDAQARRLRGIPTNNAVGQHDLILRVSNGLFETEQSFTITVLNVNDSPVITSVPALKAKEDSRYEYLILGTDIDKDDVLNFSVITKPEWLSFDEHTGILKGTPANKDVGSWTVKVQVSDGHSTAIQQFSILVENVNDTPAFVSDPLLVIGEDSPYQYTVAAEDLDNGDVLYYLVLEKPDWLNFDASIKTLHGMPTNKDVGVHTVKLQVSDGMISIEQHFIITVSNVNDAPVITSQPTTGIATGDNYQYVAKARDEDSDKLSYKAEVIPSWLNFDNETGILSGKATLPGSYNIELKVTDGLAEVSQNFSISVVQNSNPVDTISIPDKTDPTDLLLNSKSFESTTTSNQVIGSFTTVDQDHSNHIYQLVDGLGADENTFFYIVNSSLYLKNRVNTADSNQFSIRVRSTNSFGNFIEEVFILEKYDPERNASAIEIPTTFSPNADGINDTWVIKGLQSYADVSIEVYDRSGVSLYKSANPMQGWDGSISGGKLMEGPFFYIVKVQDIVKKGVLIVIK